MRPFYQPLLYNPPQSFASIRFPETNANEILVVDGMDPAGCPQNAAQTARHRLPVDGIVVSFGTTDPINKAEVELRKISWAISTCSTTGFTWGNMPDGEIRIVIGTNPGVIAGTARDENGGSMSNVIVALLPEENHRNRIDLYQSVVSDAAGNYRFSDRVPPGAYRLFAWEDVEADAWRNAAFMRLHENRGKAIRVGEGSSSNADLDVIRIR